MRFCKRGMQDLKSLFLCLLLSATGCVARKIRYTANDECDRYSLDAVYNEKYKIITENTLKDTVEFVKSVSDSLAESLSTAIAAMPEKVSSDNEDRKVFHQFKTVKNAYSNRIKKIKKKIFTRWEDLITNNFDLLYDNGKCSLSKYLKKVLNVTESYKEAKKSLDNSIGQFVSFVKSMVRDGLHGVNYAAKDSLKKEKKNSTKEVDELPPEEKLKNKKLEIIEMVAFGFLGKISAEVVKQNIDLYKEVTIKPEDRDSVLDDLLFDMLLIRNRMQAFIYDDLPVDKGSIDLARRSVYTYWGELAEEMYKEKIRSKHTTTPGGELYYKKLWSDEAQIIETLINLMEVYP